MTFRAHVYFLEVNVSFKKNKKKKLTAAKRLHLGVS